eukprot:Nk52_evm23s164 gene=Nk52_evmTU23s164
MVNPTMPSKMDPMLLRNLEEEDPVVFDLIEKEKNRQWRGIELIASENFTSKAVMEAMGSCFTNKYSEGLPGKRYYGGNEHVDELEILCQKRALEAFGLDENVWSVNVQPYSGSTCNFAVLAALMAPHGRLMGLDLPSGGHLTHGYQTPQKKISSTSVFFESMPYKVNNETGLIDYDELELTASHFRPNVLICGASAYPRDWDYARFRKIADKVGAYLMMDMAHISGLVATEEHANPFDFCDVVTSTTHKTLRGPRAGIVFMRKNAFNDPKDNLAEKINFSIFPGTQGGPHNHAIAALAVALKQVNTPEFRAYSKLVKSNCDTLCKTLIGMGYKLITDGSDNHSLLWDLRPSGVTGSKIEKVTDLVGITVNKNSVVGDKSALSPGGVRLGTSAMTSRGLVNEDFKKIAEFLHRCVVIALEVQKTAGKMMKDFVPALEGNADMKTLAEEVHKFSTSFPMPGFDVETMKFKN